jgi:hypothetical protein
MPSTRTTPVRSPKISKSLNEFSFYFLRKKIPNLSVLINFVTKFGGKVTTISGISEKGYYILSTSSLAMKIGNTNHLSLNSYFTWLAKKIVLEKMKEKVKIFARLFFLVLLDISKTRSSYFFLRIICINQIID